jgi:hypothetical protein
LVILAVCAVLPANIFAQTSFDYLAESLSKVLSFSSIVRVSDYEYNEGNALWGAFLEPGKTVSLSAQYDAGVEYLILASAHTASADIDLKVYQGQGTGGTVIARDTAPDAAPLVRFTPASSGWCTFELINASDMAAFASLVVLKYKRNANFNLSSLLESLRNTLTVARYLGETIPSNPVIPANKWTLFGGNIREGSYAGYSNTQPVRGSYILIGSGENSVINCDAEVVEQYANNNPEGRRISQNTDSEYPFDFAVFSPGPSQYYNLKVINQNSRNADAFLFGFLVLMP